MALDPLENSLVDLLLHDVAKGVTELLPVVFSDLMNLGIHVGQYQSLIGVLGLRDSYPPAGIHVC